MSYICVIEDNQGDIDLIETVTLLLNRSETIIPIINGQGILEALKVYEPRLVLLDINLPGRSGIALLSEIRGQGYINPVIVMSSSSSEDDVRVAYKNGANAYIQKPYGLKNLIEVMEGVYRFWDIAKMP